VARERDLCDVKVKITEYFDGDELTEQTGQQPPGETHNLSLDNSANGTQFFGHNAGSTATWGMPGLTIGQTPAPTAPSKKFYTIQRVNGNGGNGKGDGVAGPHKHTLDASDQVKKNSVQRWLAKNERDKKKAQVSRRFLPPKYLRPFACIAWSRAGRGYATCGTRAL
jgi:glutathione S-transferase